jgi:hypothetical protein
MKDLEVRDAISIPTVPTKTRVEDNEMKKNSGVRPS